MKLRRYSDIAGHSSCSVCQPIIVLLHRSHASAPVMIAVHSSGSLWQSVIVLLSWAHASAPMMSETELREATLRALLKILRGHILVHKGAAKSTSAANYGERQG